MTAKDWASRLSKKVYTDKRGSGSGRGGERGRERVGEGKEKDNGRGRERGDVYSGMNSDSKK